MRKSNLITALVAGGLALATMHLAAQGTEQAAQGNEDPMPAATSPQLGPQGQSPKAAGSAAAAYGASDLKASSLIGQDVRNETGVRLGKVQDLIISMKSHSVPFAIVEYGGTLGIGQTRVAVPLTALRWSSDSKELLLTATKEEFDSASTAPTGGWMAVAGEDWLKNVDRFYGQPSAALQARYERQEATGIEEGMEPVRNPAEQKGAIGLLNQPSNSATDMTNSVTPAMDDYVMNKVNGVIRQDVGTQEAQAISVTLKHGVITLQGKVANEAQKQELESQIKAVPGVHQVYNQLMISP